MCPAHPHVVTAGAGFVDAFASILIALSSPAFDPPMRKVPLRRMEYDDVDLRIEPLRAMPAWRSGLPRYSKRRRR